MDDKLALIIEDDYDASIIFSNAFESAGFEIEVIRSGDVALKRLSATMPGVVVLDLALPGVGGPEIMRQIRADPRLAKTRVIIVSAYRNLADAFRGEADIVLHKPISFSRLRDVAMRLISETVPGT